jgi:two-component system, OmpR family, sensor histidine kinase CreC
VKLGTRLFFVYLAIFLFCFSFPIYRIADDLRLRYVEGVEELLVDQAHILAAFVATDIEKQGFRPADLQQIFNQAYGPKFEARIYETLKTKVDVGVYITNAAGKVVFDSLNGHNVGKDFSNWRDVKLTLNGEYGARATREDPEDQSTSVLYVAAPIRVREKIVGSLTVVKPTTGINAFLQAAKPQIFRIGALAALAAVGLSFLVSLWVRREVGRLTRYADDVREGKRVEFPRLSNTELRDMGKAFERMLETLEGKKYAEQYVQTLTHEIKSPLSAIRSASELLNEGVPTEKAEQFLKNIRNESKRIQDLVERMLKLAELETRKALPNKERLSAATLVRQVIESKGPLIQQKNVTIRSNVPEDLSILADPFLLNQAVSNLVQNAIDFSPAGGTIAVSASIGNGQAEIRVEDEGPGLPDFALARVFEKFFSLERPDTGKKSTGLGLNFVREVATLHGGEIHLENLPSKGLRGALRLPS